MMRRTLFAIVVLAPFAAVALYRFGLLAALAPIFVTHLLMLYATFAPNSQWWGPVVRSFATTEKQVWLTIDDGPCATHTSQTLDLLDRYNARATFFVVGERAEKHPHLITEILMRGHEVANHTFTHPTRIFWAASANRIASEIDRCSPVLRPTADRPAKFFRAPVGQKSPLLHPMLSIRALQLIGWSVRGLDTVRRDPRAVARAVRRGLRPGAIILLHEAHRTDSDPSFNPTCIELVLEEVSNSGYRCVIPSPEQLRTTGAGKQKDNC